MQPPETSLLSHLQALEIELHQPSVRRDPGRLDALLHRDFLEFGRSGATYSKQDMLANLQSAVAQAEIEADRFAVRALASDVALLTYRSAALLANGTRHRFTLRSSIWQRDGADWQMSFHQGTPTAPDQRDLQAAATPVDGPKDRGPC